MALLFWLSTVSALIVYGVDDDLTLTAADDGEARTDGGNTEDGVDDVFGVNGDDGPTDGEITLTRDQRIVTLVTLGAVVAWIAGSFAGIPTIVPAAAAVAVAVLGLYATVTYSVVRRMRELGIRIALGAVLLVDLALRARNLTAFYTDAGVLPRSLLAESYPLARFSLYAVSGEAWVVGLLFLIAAVAATALAIGYRTRTATAVSLVLLASLQARNPFVLNAGDTLFWQLLGAGLLCPLGARWSVDAVRRRAALGRRSLPENDRFTGPA
jgi:hypothetical protein